MDEILDFHLSEDRPMLTIIFKMGYTLFVQYNDYNEYSYHFQLAQKSNELIRYDNFDDRWNVSTKPHHFHPGDKQTATESSMKGLPEIDMLILVQKLMTYL